MRTRAPGVIIRLPGRPAASSLVAAQRRRFQPHEALAPLLVHGEALDDKGDGDIERDKDAKEPAGR